MNCIKTTFVLCVLFVIPIASQEVDNTAEQGENFEGDMILNSEQKMATEGSLRNVFIAKKYRWPNNTLRYRIDIESFDPSQIEHIHEAMATIESVSCVKFAEAGQNVKNYVKIVAEKPGCFATLGYHGSVQVLNLTPNRVGYGCFRLGTIMHELLHALGFVHQQSAANRNDYVKILWKNIIPEQKHNFKKYDYSKVTDFNLGYDYGSVMHYSARSFSKNGEPTIITKDDSVTIGQRQALSEKDIIKLNRLYNCKRDDQS
ncbi:seminal metalloprotease 1 [Aedes aegypti]|uniref:Metalloendopeptidase n=1 Tax=Aedes aegypti TaxID=7159 RepID=A0A1S4FZ39_AEDAE|nr:seminal metalloprotease 1 [Aedes aegypti]